MLTFVDRPHRGPIFLRMCVLAPVCPERDRMYNLDAADIVAHTQADFTDRMGQKTRRADL